MLDKTGGIKMYTIIKIDGNGDVPFGFMLPWKPGHIRQRNQCFDTSKETASDGAVI